MEIYGVYKIRGFDVSNDSFWTTEKKAIERSIGIVKEKNNLIANRRENLSKNGIKLQHTLFRKVKNEYCWRGGYLREEEIVVKEIDVNE